MGQVMNRMLKIALVLLALLGGAVSETPAAADVCQRNPSLCR